MSSLHDPRFVVNYTLRARKFSRKYPTLSYLIIQIDFWFVAFLVFYCLIKLHQKYISIIHSYEFTGFSLSGFLITSIIAIVYGLVLGGSSLWLEKHWAKSKSIGVILLAHVSIYVFIMLGIYFIIRYIAWDTVSPVLNLNEEVWESQSIWKYFFLILLIYTFVMDLVIGFINQMNKKFGPGIILPMMLGKYRYPKEENRIFMFLDLESSTTHAENLGHIRYSELIRDCFIDINHVIAKHQVEVYQYVGDEVVLSWLVTKDLDWMDCVELYFNCQFRFIARKENYISKYGFLPMFKGGVHQGLITAVEVGDLKRDIAYHGDTINTSSRIRGMCREYESDLLISEALEKNIVWNNKYSKQLVGEVMLRGKQDPINLYKVNLGNN